MQVWQKTKSMHEVVEMELIPWQFEWMWLIIVDSVYLIIIIYPYIKYCQYFEFSRLECNPLVGGIWPSAFHIEQYVIQNVLCLI